MSGISDLQLSRRLDQPTATTGCSGAKAVRKAGWSRRWNYKKRLAAILDGEPPFDIFVRWKPIQEQPVGWEPDINDGVRLNIRPFMADDIRGGKKGAGILRTKPNIHWRKDRGKETFREQESFPWFWSCPGTGTRAERADFRGGRDFDGNRWNDLHYTNAAKQAARSQMAVEEVHSVTAPVTATDEEQPDAMA